MKTADRRSFLKSSAAAGVAITAAARKANAAGANSRLRIGLIGCGGRGGGVARSFAELADVEISYACDPDEDRAGKTADSLPGKPRALKDLRKVLDDKSVDAVIVATPDHWHSPASILALDAGKHVYVEKPCSHNVLEGRLLVEAARRSQRLVQHGTQSRSDGLIQHGIGLVRSGIIGDVLIAKAWNVQRRGAIGHGQPGEPPSGFDYDLWVGPAEMVPFRTTCHHYNWHWWYNFGTGDTGNDGVHEIDIARWGLGVDSHPSSVSAVGGKYAFDDDQQFPDTQLVAFEYPGGGHVGDRRQLVFEMRLWSRYGLEGVDNGNAFYGTKGWMLLSKRGILKVFDERNRPVLLKSEEPKPRGHQQNLVDAIRGDAKLTADIGEGHLSATLCHLANISTRLGRSINFDTDREQVVNDDQGDAMLSRRYRSEGHWAIPVDALA